MLVNGLIVIADKPNNRICRNAFGEIFPPRHPGGHKNDKNAALLPATTPLFDFSGPSYTQSGPVLKMDHPCFFDSLFERICGDFQTDGGRVCPFGFDGSVAVLCGGMPGRRSAGRYQNNKPDPASSFGKHKNGCSSIDKQQKLLSRHSALQFAGSRAMLAVNLRLWWFKVQVPKKPEIPVSGFSFLK
ncbi:MAG: hypothetical protein PF690_01315 [Deltaproteobacteria bacterium]|nr:hypothetical protein [Deltaproteobacteria bacterium]